jgi:hypothetical protein
MKQFTEHDYQTILAMSTPIHWALLYLLNHPDTVLCCSEKKTNYWAIELIFNHSSKGMLDMVAVCIGSKTQATAKKYMLRVNMQHTIWMMKYVHIKFLEFNKQWHWSIRFIKAMESKANRKRLLRLKEHIHSYNCNKKRLRKIWLPVAEAFRYYIGH